jgi:hypothetical protein
MLATPWFQLISSQSPSPSPTGGTIINGPTTHDTGGITGDGDGEKNNTSWMMKSMKSGDNENQDPKYQQYQRELERQVIHLQTLLEDSMEELDSALQSLEIKVYFVKQKASDAQKVWFDTNGIAARERRRAVLRSEEMRRLKEEMEKQEKEETELKMKGGRGDHFKTDRQSRVKEDGGGGTDAGGRGRKKPGVWFMEWVLKPSSSLKRSKKNSQLPPSSSASGDRNNNNNNNNRAYAFPFHPHDTTAPTSMKLLKISERSIRRAEKDVEILYELMSTLEDIAPAIVKLDHDVKILISNIQHFRASFKNADGGGGHRWCWWW